MKQIFLFLLLAPFHAFTQTSEPTLKKIYAEMGAGAATNNGAVYSYGVTAVFKKNWTAGLMHYNVEQNPKNLPADYQQGFFFLIPEPMPFVTTSLVAVTAGKLFPVGQKTWLTTDAGITFGSGQEMTFTRQAVQELILFRTSNYQTSTKSKSTMGGIVRADVNWAFLSFLGIGAGGFASFNSAGSAVGFQFKLVAGKMNTRRKS